MPRQKLTKRADGRYACRYDGRFFYGKSTAEAIRRRDEYIREKDKGYNMDLADTVFADYGKTWLDAYRTECNPMQRRQYQRFIDYAAEKLNRRLMRAITATDIQKLYNTLNGYSQSYINKFTSTIRSIFRAALQDGIIIRSPAELAQPPKGESGGHRALELWEQELVEDTCMDHDFGPAAMVMLYAGLRRGEVLYLDVGRDVDFEARTISVRGAVSFCEGNQGVITDGKTENAQRTIPLADPLAKALEGIHGLLLTKADGDMMSESAFDRKYQSYITFLERKLNGYPKCQYGRTRAHKALLAEGKELPPWQEINIRCHDFRVTFCTMCYNADIPPKTTQVWMGHADTKLVMDVYTKLTAEKEQADALKLNAFICRRRPAPAEAEDASKKKISPDNENFSGAAAAS